VDSHSLLFFFGVMFSVGGLAFIGYLGLASGLMYGTLGADSGQYLHGRRVSIGRQHSGNVFGAFHAARHATFSMVTGNADLRCRWQPAFDRFQLPAWR